MTVLRNVFKTLRGARCHAALGQSPPRPCRWLRRARPCQRCPPPCLCPTGGRLLLTPVTATSPRGDRRGDRPSTSGSGWLDGPRTGSCLKGAFSAAGGTVRPPGRGARPPGQSFAAQAPPASGLLPRDVPWLMSPRSRLQRAPLPAVFSLSPPGTVSVLVTSEQPVPRTPRLAQSQRSGDSQGTVAAWTNG